MAEHGVKTMRVINAGGIPQKNKVLNQVYANVLERPVLVPNKSVTSLGSAIFAFRAAGTFKTLEEAQDKMCPQHTVFTPDASTKSIYDELFALYRKIYLVLGSEECSVRRCAAFADSAISHRKLKSDARRCEVRMVGSPGLEPGTTNYEFAALTN